MKMAFCTFNILEKVHSGAIRNTLVSNFLCGYNSVVGLDLALDVDVVLGNDYIYDVNLATFLIL